MSPAGIKKARRGRSRAGQEGWAMLRVDAVVCGAYRYAELAAPISGCRRIQAVDALHNYTGRPTSLNIAISLSGTWNLPRLSIGGTPMARASSFSVGSARR